MTNYTQFPEAFYPLLNRSGTILLQTSRFDNDNYRSMLFMEPLEVVVANSADEIPGAFERVQDALDHGHYVAGYTAYDCGALSEFGLQPNLSAQTRLVWFGSYKQAYVFDHRSGTFAPEPPLRSDPADTVHGELRPMGLAMSAGEHAAKVAAIHDYIRAGDTYQVNLTTGLQLEYSGSPAAIFSALGRQQRVAYSALINDGSRSILSFSPELFYRTVNNRITTRPMKGTAPRGRYQEEDRRAAEWLANDAKNRSENVMIVDLLRNDLGRVCEFGTVSVDRLFETERYETVWQMTSTVRGQLRRDVSQVDVFKHLFPCGSVTGAPKLRTMEIIRELEKGPRGVYTGAIGYFGPNGDTVFNVAIRTLVLEGGRGEMGVGSGIVIDSNAESEYAECKLKADFLTRRNDDHQLIEALLWDRGYPFLELHMERLQDSAAYFDFEFHRTAILGALAEHAKQLTVGTRYKVRLLLDRKGTLTIENAAVEDSPGTGKVTLATDRTCSSDRFLFHKTTRRETYDRLFRQAAQSGYDDVLFLNERDEVTEGAISNLFIVVGGRWYTPPVDCGVLAGVYRRHLLETHPGAAEKVLRVEDVVSADAIYICNAVRGLRRVTFEPLGMVAGT